MKIAQTSRKRKVKREVTSDERKRLRKAAKRRKRKGGGNSNMFDDYDDDGMEDFIADDDEEDFEHYDYYNLPDDDNSSVPSPTKSTASSVSDSMHPRAAKRSRFDPLTNVILLAGPIASGKTSTAYAVANELQWQVFEVYPGIGKRGYKDIERYVGMVGDNHIMKRDTPAIASIFGKPSTSTSSTLSSSLTSKNGPSKTDSNLNGTGSSKVHASLHATTGNISTTITTSVIKQSFILIEEVDLLYGSDSGFWEGLINFISKSRRPVILTCNDITSIPKDSIPLQCVLEFESVDEGTIKNVLKHVADAEVLDVKQEDIARIVEETYTDGYPDIRKALNQLQCIGASLNSTSETRRSEAVQASTSKESLKLVRALLENASFADAELSRRNFMSFEVRKINMPCPH
jgi:DNA polymerase III delta prime subunit